MLEIFPNECVWLNARKPNLTVTTTNVSKTLHNCLKIFKYFKLIWVIIYPHSSWQGFEMSTLKILLQNKIRLRHSYCQLLTQQIGSYSGSNLASSTVILIRVAAKLFVFVFFHINFAFREFSFNFTKSKENFAKRETWINYF